MSNYVDLSSFNPENIDYSRYIPWSQQGDGISRIALRISQGVNDPDTLFLAHYDKAKAAGVQQFVFYHFGYPWLNPNWAGAQAEAQSFLGILAGRCGADDLVMLDAESFEGKAGPADWYWDWLHLVSELASLPTERVTIYANPSYIRSNLQAARLADFPLILADWTFNSSSRPAAPLPWSSYLALQYTDKGVVPGIPEAVDADIFLHAPVVAPDLAKIKADLLDALAQLGG